MSGKGCPGNRLEILASPGIQLLKADLRACVICHASDSDRTYVLVGGGLQMEGTPGELSTSPEFVDSFLGGGAR